MIDRIKLTIIGIAMIIAGFLITWHIYGENGLLHDISYVTVCFFIILFAIFLALAGTILILYVWDKL